MMKDQKIRKDQRAPGEKKDPRKGPTTRYIRLGQVNSNRQNGNLSPQSEAAMSANDCAGEAEADDSDDKSRSQAVTEAVGEVIYRRSLPRADIGRTSSYEATPGSVSPSSSAHGQQGVDKTVSISQEERGEVPVRSIGGTETREEHHACFTGGGMRLSLTPEQDRSGSQLQASRGETQTLATADKSSVINIQEVHLHQTNVKNENCAGVSVGGNVTVSSGTEQETLAPQARRQLTQAQEELKAMRESTSEQLREWTAGMVQTKAVDVLVEQLSKGPGVYILKGQPGEGKTTVAKMALKRLEDKSREVFVVTKPADYFTVKSVKESVILLNDIFGSSYFHLDNLSPWQKVFDDYLSLQEHKDVSQPKSKPTILLVSRSSVLDSAAKHLGRFKALILNDDCTMDMTKDMEYTVKEKVKIWSYYASRYKVDLEERTVLSACKMNHPHGFPHCCRLFAEMYAKNQQLKMEMFFLKPLEFLQQGLESVFEDEIAGMLFRQMLKSDGKLRVDSLFESEEKLFHVQKTIGKYQGLYFRKEGNVVSFHHPSIYDTVAFIACKVVPLFVVQNCNMTFLNDRVRLADISGPETEQQQTVEIDNSYKQQFMDRLGNEITEGNISDVLSHASFHDEHFVRDFMEKIVSANIQHETKSQVLHNIINTSDKKTGDPFLFLCSKSKSNKILKYICERVRLTQEDQKSVLFDICNHRSEASLQYFLETFPHCDLTVRNERGETLLMVAARNPCDYILKTLMDRGVSVNAKDLGGHTALEYICEYGVENDPSIVETMVRKGAHISDSNIFIACKAGEYKIIIPLLHMGVDINATDFKGDTPLTTACIRGHNTVVTTLLDKGADRNKPGGHGKTPLTTACWWGRNTVVTTLLEKGADRNKPGRNGDTPLTAACRERHNTVVTTLLDKGADKNKTDRKGQTPLTTACRSGHNTVVTTLLDRGADRNKPDRIGITPLSVACRYDRNTVVTTLLDKGANINARDGMGDTPLTAACTCGFNTVVTTLLDKGAVIDTPVEEGTTPLRAACNRGHNTVVTTLLDKGADINKPDGRGDTPLTAACNSIWETYAVVTTLIGRGADVNKPNRRGETPLSIARRRGYDTIIALLDRKGKE